MSCLGTKERIIEEALELFSKKGYAGTSIKEIADAVSIKDSSLYKHFKSKKEIFDTIVTIMSNRMEQLATDLHFPDLTEEGIEQYGSMNLDYLIELTQKVFLFYAKDDYAAKFRRMLTIEQYNSSETAGLYRKIYMEDSIQYQTMMFEKLVKQGFLKEVDPMILAINYYTPIFYFICRYDNDHSKEQEALEMVKCHVTEFYRIYNNHL